MTDRLTPHATLHRLAERAARGSLNPSEVVDAAAQLGAALLKSLVSETRATPNNGSCCAQPKPCGAINCTHPSYVPSAVAPPTMEPYGYVWFNKHMEQRFTHRLPHPESSEQPIGDAVPVYRLKDLK